MNAGEAVFVGEQLKGAGIYGAIIIVLMGVITIMAGVIAIQWRHSNKVYGYRLAERDTLNKTINESKNALHEMLASMEDRNDITKELSDVIQKQAVSFEVLLAKLSGWVDNIEKEFVRQAQVIAAQAEATRQIVAITTDMRNAVTASNTTLEEMKKLMPTFLRELRSIIQALPKTKRRP